VSVQVRPASRRDRPVAVRVLRNALVDDPAWTAVLPDRRRRAAALRTILTVALVDAGGHAQVAVRDGAVVGAAIWQPPGRYPMTAARQARTVPRMLALGAVLGRDMRTVVRFGARIDAVFPSRPVRYLQALGVAPGAQRAGVGAALLREGLDRADAGGEETYLETGAADNVGYYARWGFAPVAPGVPLGVRGPVMWRMLRPAGAGPQDLG
jgi:predicted N-acetyltransferase YhbS